MLSHLKIGSGWPSLAPLDIFIVMLDHPAPAPPFISFNQESLTVPNLGPIRGNLESSLSGNKGSFMGNFQWTHLLFHVKTVKNQFVPNFPICRRPNLNKWSRLLFTNRVFNLCQVHLAPVTSEHPLCLPLPPPGAALTFPTSRAGRAGRVGPPAMPPLSGMQLIRYKQYLYA